MSELARSCASISFHGDDLRHQEITQRLGCRPSSGRTKGQEWLTAKGIAKTARTGAWILESGHSAPGDLDRQVNDLLDRMGSDFDTWIELSERYQGRIFCGLFLEEFNEGTIFQPRTLARVAERGLRLDLDIYGAEDETKQ